MSARVGGVADDVSVPGEIVLFAKLCRNTPDDSGK